MKESVLQMSQIELEISNPCNEKCVHCYRHCLNTQKGFLSVEQAKSALEQAKNLGAKSVTITGGEALLNPNWKEIIKIADELEFRVSLFTNGTLLKEEDADFLLTVKHLKEVQFSLYALDEDIHDSITGLKGSCIKTKNAIQILHSKNIPIFVSSPTMKQNKIAVTEVMKWCDNQNINSCADIFIFGSSDYEGKNLNNRLSEDDLKDFFEITMQDNACLSYVWGNKNSECDFSKELFYSGFSNRLLVSGDGTIYPMIGFYKKIGHIDTDKLEDVFYNNELLKQARKITIDDIPECKNCSLKEYCNFCCTPHLTANNGDFYKVDKSFCDFIKFRKEMILRRDELLKLKS